MEKGKLYELVAVLLLLTFFFNLVLTWNSSDIQRFHDRYQCIPKNVSVWIDTDGDPFTPGVYWNGSEMEYQFLVRECDGTFKCYDDNMNKLINDVMRER